MTRGYLLDTNHVGQSVRPGSIVKARIIALWPIEVATAEHYGIIHQELRRRGRVLSQVDIMLAALARQMRLTLITSDRDFTALPDVATENWLST